MSSTPLIIIINNNTEVCVILTKSGVHVDRYWLTGSILATVYDFRQNSDTDVEIVFCV